MASLLSLPQELHDSICDVVDQRSLARLASTSKAWYESAKPVLWRYVWTLDALLKLMRADAGDGAYSGGIVAHKLIDVYFRNGRRARRKNG